MARVVRVLTPWLVGTALIGCAGTAFLSVSPTRSAVVSAVAASVAPGTTRQPAASALPGRDATAARERATRRAPLVRPVPSERFSGPVVRAYPQQKQQGSQEEPRQTHSKHQQFRKQQWPGLEGYTVLQPNVAYGYRPTTVGLRWLQARGFVTVLDLSAKPDPAEGPMCRQLGLNYHNEPITAQALAREEVQKRLIEFLSHPKYRPLYVHDENGELFAAVWLLFRVRHGGADEAVVRRELAAIGVRPEGAVWQAAVEAISRAK